MRTNMVRLYTISYVLFYMTVSNGSVAVPNVDYRIARPTNRTTTWPEGNDQEVEDLEQTDEGGEGMDDTGETPRAAPLNMYDYMARLEWCHTDLVPLGIVRVVLDITAERWEAGDVNTVGGIANYIQEIDVQGLPRATCMMFEALRRTTAEYREFGTTRDLSPYWHDWLLHVTTACVTVYLKSMRRC